MWFLSCFRLRFIFFNSGHPQLHIMSAMSSFFDCKGSGPGRHHSAFERPIPEMVLDRMRRNVLITTPCPKTAQLHSKSRHMVIAGPWGCPIYNWAFGSYVGFGRAGLHGWRRVNPLTARTSASALGRTSCKKGLAALCMAEGEPPYGSYVDFGSDPNILQKWPIGSYRPIGLHGWRRTSLRNDNQLFSSWGDPGTARSHGFTISRLYDEQISGNYLIFLSAS